MTNIQPVAERNITMVALANIQPSDYNPRKNFVYPHPFEIRFTDTRNRRIIGKG